MPMREDMAKGLAEETAGEEGALKSYSDLMAAKEQVVLVRSKPQIHKQMMIMMTMMMVMMMMRRMRMMMMARVF